MNRARIALALLFVVVACACRGGRVPEVVMSVPVATLPGHDAVRVDATPKEEARLVPAEAYVRTYMQLFGGLAPLKIQDQMHAASGGELFDAWTLYLTVLGLPEYRSDSPRLQQTSTVMVATFERLGEALCDHAAENDLKPETPASARVVFAFELAGEDDLASFSARFDVLHRTFLGYPLRLAPANRVARFYELYRSTINRHRTSGVPGAKLDRIRAAWAVVCSGLIRHPEFHLY